MVSIISSLGTKGESKIVLFHNRHHQCDNPRKISFHDDENEF